MLSRARAKITPALSSRLRFGEENLDRHLSLPQSSFDGAVVISVLQGASGCAEPCACWSRSYSYTETRCVFVVLHFLRPDYYDNSLWDQVQTQIRILKRKTPGNMVLASAKIMAEHSNSSLYWSVDELHELLKSQGFQIESTPETNPIIVVARKADSL